MSLERIIWFVIGFAVAFNLCALAYAELPTQICEIHDQSGIRLASCDEAWRIREEVEPPCLKQMEAAMRVMDEWVDRGVWRYTDGGMQYEQKLDIYTLMTSEFSESELNAREHRRQHAIRLWEMAIKDCWRP